MSHSILTHIKMRSLFSQTLMRYSVLSTGDFCDDFSPLHFLPASSPDPLAWEPLACPVPSRHIHFHLLSPCSVCSKKSPFATDLTSPGFLPMAGHIAACPRPPPQASADGWRREGYSMDHFLPFSVTFQLPVAFLPKLGNPEARLVASL